MDKLKLRKLLIAASILALILIVFVLIEYGTFSSNVRNGNTDSSQVHQSMSPK